MALSSDAPPGTEATRSLCCWFLSADDKRESFALVAARQRPGFPDKALTTFVRMTEDFLAIPDFTPAELNALFDLAQRMKDGKYKDKPLAGQSLAMIFMKSSTRTRVSF